MSTAVLEKSQQYTKRPSLLLVLSMGNTVLPTPHPTSRIRNVASLPGKVSASLFPWAQPSGCSLTPSEALVWSLWLKLLGESDSWHPGGREDSLLSSSFCSSVGFSPSPSTVLRWCVVGRSAASSGFCFKGKVCARWGANSGNSVKSQFRSLKNLSWTKQIRQKCHY